MFLYPTDKDEIRKIINMLKTRKAPGHDDITSRLLKHICESILDVLTCLINFSKSSGEFPDILKFAVVIPLYKKSDKFSPSNYRPISLLLVFSKIIEKVVKSRLVNFLNSKNYFSDQQFGFRSGKNTNDALLCFMMQVYNGVNEGKYCAGLFVNVMEAFDTVDHTMLLNRLNDAGVRGIPQKWFASYLSDRCQQTRVGDELSDREYLQHGILQGSVLSGHFL